MVGLTSEQMKNRSPLFLALKKQTKFPLCVYHEKPDGSEPEQTGLMRQNRTHSELESAESPSEGAKNLLNPGLNRFLSVGDLSALLGGLITRSLWGLQTVKEGIMTVRDERLCTK